METESKYLKKIRDVLRKKNSGSSSGTIYSGPNTKAKYLNDIAKEVDKLDISGGGSSESPFFIVKTRTDVTPDGPVTTMVQSVAQVESAIEAGKIIFLQQGNGLIKYSGKAIDGNNQYYTFKNMDITTGQFPSQDPSEEAPSINILNYTIRIKLSDKTVDSKTITYLCKVEDIAIQMVS